MKHRITLKIGGILETASLIERFSSLTLIGDNGFKNLLQRRLILVLSKDTSRLS
jgi:hypothetical protein